MNREKMREQIRNLREKRTKRSIVPKKVDTVPVRSVPKPQIKQGVVKVESLSSKRGTPTQAVTNKADRRRHTQIMRSAQKHGGGCGGCRRKVGNG